MKSHSLVTRLKDFHRCWSVSQSPLSRDDHLFVISGYISLRLGFSFVLVIKRIKNKFFFKVFIHSFVRLFVRSFIHYIEARSDRGSVPYILL